MIQLRPARDNSEEIENILAFWIQNAENGSRPTDTAEAISTLIMNDPDALILAFDHDELVGTIIAGWNGWRSGLYRLAVRDDSRSRGVGRLLVERALERLQTVGATRVDAMVLDENLVAHRAWEAYGFTRQDNWSRWVLSLETP